MHTLTHAHPHTCIPSHPHTCHPHTLTHAQLLMQHKRHLAELRTTRVEKEQLLQRVHDLETQLKASEGEVEDITMEVELLKSKLKEAQSTTGSVPATRLHVFLCMWYLGGFSLLVLKAGGSMQDPPFSCLSYKYALWSFSVAWFSLLVSAAVGFLLKARRFNCRDRST